MEKIINIRRLAGTVLLFIVLANPVALLKAQDVKNTEAVMLKQAEENIEKYRKGDVQIVFRTSDGKPLKNATVEVHQTTHDFLFGCIIFDLVGDNDPYKPELFKEQFSKIFNLAVFPFYWSGYEAKQGETRWAAMSETLEWCKANGITTKGHPLVWATKPGTPDWLAGYKEKETEEFLKTRVLNITAGFKGKIELFDVVNEPIHVRTWKHKIENFADTNDWDVSDTLPQVADYVESALRWAHQGNPRATLMINEYRTLADAGDRRKYEDLLTELKKRNVPLGGIGIQAHEPRQDWFSPVEVWKTFDLYSKFGYPLHITEFTPQASGVPITGGWRTGNWSRESQAEFTEQFFKLCFGHPAVVSINIWGLSDRDNWIPGAGLIDEEYRPKPVYQMLDKLINHKWKTNLSVKTDNQGSAAFRGFFGEYEIIVKPSGGKDQYFSVHPSKNEENRWVFTVN
jgi:endo-1,4-beta-xylanase